MGAAFTAQGKGPHGQPQGINGLAILHRQDVIGRLQQRGAPGTQLLQHPLTGRGKGKRGVLRHHRADSRQRLRLVQTPGQRLQYDQIVALSSEAQPVCPQSPQQPHRTAGEALSRCQGPGQRQFEHQIGAAVHRGPGTGEFVKQRRLAPLHEVPRHHAHDALIAQLTPALAQMAGVAVMKGVVFTYDADKAHAVLHCYVNHICRAET